MRKIYHRAMQAPSMWYTNKANLNEILDCYDKHQSDLNNLYDDISEFQNCMLVTDINQKQAEIETLSDQVRILTLLESKIIIKCVGVMGQFGKNAPILLKGYCLQHRIKQWGFSLPIFTAILSFIFFNTTRKQMNIGDMRILRYQNFLKRT